MTYRLMMTLILIPIVISAIFMLPPVGFKLIILVVCFLSAWEWGQLAGLVIYSQRIGVAILCGVLLALMMFVVPVYAPHLVAFQVSYVLWTALAWWLLTLFLVLYYPRSAILWKNSILLRLIFGALTILPFFLGMLTLRQHHYDINHLTGAWWLLYVMLLVWASDSGAYVFGRALGRHKLASKVSPGKTWEGFLGGLLTSVIMGWLFTRYVSLEVSLVTLLICSSAAVLASVLGDLTESMFKREAGTKDSGHLIPGHGGILDRIDSLSAAVPVFVCLVSLVFNII